eukprot:2783097-Rhodomonas_salina.3
MGQKGGLLFPSSCSIPIQSLIASIVTESRNKIVARAPQKGVSARLLAVLIFVGLFLLAETLPSYSEFGSGIKRMPKRGQGVAAPSGSKKPKINTQKGNEDAAVSTMANFEAWLRKEGFGWDDKDLDLRASGVLFRPCRFSPQI